MGALPDVTKGERDHGGSVEQGHAAVVAEMFAKTVRAKKIAAAQ
jgi:hypothetical protein